ncbi:hypothetical protein A2W14_02115 [Candidatus Gottesmanbacteria bacterium RBG_16_37_8]|uniref:Ribbon-helix-helix protein CopG domain-containing protein n=1 Tax=Candidatus Gottesmanbacteria bacterium RBG_16_37_8 TaxID=1798371 RepID=A0A1F5YRY8_9BACT|nr:MAG: hypothetical protein A2W14_02115 [Candidatus Gottesmanbacteria bacterium RBG_16_37_8]
MIQRKFYLPEELYQKMQLQAKIDGKTITDVLRDLVKIGLKVKERKQTGRGAKKLYELSQLAQKEKWSGPSDLSISHDKYFTLAK